MAGILNQVRPSRFISELHSSRGNNTGYRPETGTPNAVASDPMIDDKEEGLELRNMVLEATGYSVLLATDGARGLKLFARHPVAAVVLDYVMPRMNGGEVAAKMRRIKPDVPIILLSGMVSEMPSDALNVVDLFIAKGSPAVSLIQELKRLVPLISPTESKPQRQEVFDKAEKLISAARGCANRGRQVLHNARQHLDSSAEKRKKE